MPIQQAVSGPAAELHLISSFVTVALCIEIVVIFALPTRGHQGGKATWMRVFMIHVISSLAAHGVEVIVLVIAEDSNTALTIVYQVNLLVVDVKAFFLFQALSCFERFNRGPPLVSARMAMVASLAVLGIHVVEFASAGNLTRVPPVTNAVLGLQAIAIPTAVAALLLYRSDRFIRKHYLAMFTGVLVAGVGGWLHVQFIGPSFGPLDPLVVLAAFVSSYLLIAGTATFLVALYMLPYIEDMYWRQAIASLAIIDTVRGTIIFKQDLGGGFAGEPAALRDEALVGGISGIDDFVSSLMEEPQGKLGYIDNEGTKLLLSWRKDLLFLLVVNKYLPVLKVKLDEFNERFFNVIGVPAAKKLEDPGLLKRARDLAASIFDRQRGGGG